MSMIGTIILQELHLTRASGWGGVVPVLFFLSSTLLAPFALGPNPVLLAQMAGGLAWMSALLALLLSLERLFQPDAEDGTLDQWIVLNQSLAQIGLAKIMAHWLTTAVPLILASPLAAIMLGLPLDQLVRLMLSLLVGTPALSALGAACAALTVPVRRGALLLSLLLVPLAIPVLIFGVAAFDADRQASALKLLASLSLCALTFAPLAISAALKESVS
jgi:heme exporter protein B